MWEFEKLISDIINSSTVQTIFGNPIYSAIIIVSMVLLIIYLTTRHEIELVEDSEYSMMGLMFTSGIYCIIAVLTLVYLQHRSISQEFERRYSQRSLNNVVSATLGGTVAPVDIYDPMPALLEGSEEEDYYAEESDQEYAQKKRVNKRSAAGKKKKQSKSPVSKPKQKKEPEAESEESEPGEEEGNVSVGDESDE
jgi:hypothetical protein